MKTKSKILSLLLAAVMVIGMLPTIAFAYTEGAIPGTTGSGTASDPVIVDTFAELKGALESTDDIYIRVDSFKGTSPLSYYVLQGGEGKDYVNGGSAIKIPSGVTKNLTVNTTIRCETNDLVNYLYSFITCMGTLYLDGTGKIDVGFNANGYPSSVLYIMAPGNVNISNLYLSGDRSTYIGSPSFGRAIWHDSGTLNILSGTFEGISHEGDGRTMNAVSLKTGTTTNIFGGNFLVTSSDNKDGLSVSDGAILKLYGGTFQYGIGVDTGKTIGDYLAEGATATISGENTIITSTGLTFPDNGFYDVPAGTTGTIYTATTAFTAAGGTAPYTFTVDPAVSGMSINNENKLVFTRPAISDAITATIKVTDSAAPAMSKTITINVGEVTATKISSVSVTVTDPAAGKYPAVPTSGANTSINPGSVTWQEVDSSGKFIKTLTSADSFEAGKNYKLTVIVNPNSGYEFTSTTTATINGNAAIINILNDNAINCSYIFTATATPELTFADNAAYDVPAGTKDTIYTATTAFTATGGTTPYTFTVDPAVSGMSINDENKLVFTRPAVSDATTATIKVTDSAAAAMSKTITINVGAVTTAMTEISSVSVTDITAPVAGVTPDTTASTTANTTIRLIDWYEVDSERGLIAHANTKPFEAGKTYRMGCIIDPTTGYKFTSNATATINGNAATIKEQSLDWISCYYDFAVPYAISSVAITDIIAPVADALPDTTASTTANTIIRLIDWHEVNSEGGLIAHANTKPFEAGKTYRMGCIVDSAEGYNFTEDATVTINDETADISDQSTEWISCYYIFTVPAEESPNVISSATVTVTAPAAGGNPAVPTAGTNTSITQYGWEDISGSASTGLTSADTFQAGKTYRLRVYILTASGYSFTETPTATINGNTATIDSKASYYIFCHYDFAIPEEESPKILSAATVTVTAPVAGGHPAVPTSGTNTSIAEYGWEDISGSATSVDTFQAGKTYRLRVNILIASAEYSFTETPTATINGNTATIDSKGSYYIFCHYDFAIPAEESPTITGITVSPAKTSIQKGNNQSFTATVTGTGAYDSTVTWNVTGGVDGTSINSSGLLTVAADETAATLTIKATANGDVAKTDTATVTVTSAPVTKYTLTVTNGAGDGDYEAGATVNISADTAPAGYQFKNWSTSGGGSFGDVNSANTTFTMPNADTTVTAVWEDIPAAITGVTVSPTTASIQKGNRQTFTATVTGTGAYDSTVTWSVTGGISGTSIDAAGELTVAASETATTLTVTATANGDSGKAATATVTVKDAPVTKYTLTVTNGTGGGSYEADAEIAIVADAPAPGKVFDTWEVVSGGATFADLNNATTTVTMPASDAEVKATYKEDIHSHTWSTDYPGKDADYHWNTCSGCDEIKDKADHVYTDDPDTNCDTCGYVRTIAVTKYTVTVKGSRAATTGAGEYESGNTVTIYAGTRSGYSFNGWTVVSGNVTLSNANSANTSFTMPDKAVTVKANWSYNGGGGGGGYSYYTIKARAGAGGSITPSGSASIRENKDKTFTISPNTGYVISDVLVDGKSVGTVKTYTFKDVSKAHTIKATFKLAEEHSNPQTGVDFEDVKETDWFYDHVRYVYENKMMVGTSATLFSPQMDTTRGMIVTILYQLAGEPAVSATTPFDDVKSGSYYEDAITWVATNKIVAGYGNSKFGPDDPITREQMATILYHFAEYKGYDVSKAADLTGFSDADSISDYALISMKWANAEGLITGTTKTTLAPAGNAVRCQVAAIIHRFLDIIDK